MRIREHHGGELADRDRIREHAVSMFVDWTGRGTERAAMFYASSFHKPGASDPPRS